jgi:hypothetical protein
MTFRITRHAKVIVPESFRVTENNAADVAKNESKGIKRVMQKSIIGIPVISAGSAAAVAGFAPALNSLGAGMAAGLFLATMVASMSSLIIVPCMIKYSIDNGTKKYWPGRATIKSFNPPDRVPTIEPFAEWDNVFLPFTVEAFNGVSVKDESGNTRKPIRLHTGNYIELRTETRKQGIDYSLVEAQKIS